LFFQQKKNLFLCQHACNLVERIVQKALMSSPVPINETIPLPTPMPATVAHPNFTAENLKRCLDVTTVSATTANKRVCTSSVDNSASATSDTHHCDLGNRFDRFGRIMWTDHLHLLFLQAIEELGIYG
jgi:hypothetical protein